MMTTSESNQPHIPRDNPFRVAARVVIEVNRKALDDLKGK